MIPEVRNPSQAALELAETVPKRLALVPGYKRHAIAHAFLGLAIGRPVNDDHLIECAVTWIQAGHGCSISTAWKNRIAVAQVFGLDLVPAKGHGFLCDPRSILVQLTADQRAAFLIAARRMAIAGDIRRPLLDQVPLGPPLELPLVKQGKHKLADACPSCQDADSFTIRKHLAGHQTGWCHRCQVGFTITGHHARQWALGKKRGPSANGRPDPGLVKRPTQPKNPPSLRPIRSNDPGRSRDDDPGAWPWEHTGLSAERVVTALGGRGGPVGSPGVTAWESKGGRCRVAVAGAMVVVRRWDGAVLFNDHATPTTRAEIWKLLRRA